MSNNLENFTKEELLVRLSKLQKEQLNNGFFNLIALPFQLLDNNGNIIDVNQKWLDELGYQKNEVIKHNFSKFIIKEQEQKFISNLNNLEKGNLVCNNEYTIVKKNGDYVNVIANCNSVYDSDNKLTKSYCILVDSSLITNNKNNSTKNENKFQELIDFLPIVFFETNKEGVLTFVNKTAFDVFRCTQEDFDKGINIFEFVIPEEHNKLKEVISKKIEGENTNSNKYKLINKNGQKFDSLINTVPIFKNNIFNGFRGFLIDISYQTSIENKLIESEKNYKQLTKQLPDIIIVHIDGIVVYSNEVIYNLLGYTSEESIGKNIFEFIHDSDHKLILEKYTKRLEGTADDEPYEIKVISKSGEIKNFEIRVNDILFNNQISYLTVLTDITQKKNIEKALNQSQVFLESVLKTTTALIYIYDLENHSNIYSNNEIEKILGYSPEQLRNLGNKIFELMLHPEDTVKVYEHYSKFAGKVGNDSHILEYRMKHSKGYWVWLHSRDTVFTRDDNGNTKQIIGSAIDITELKMNEEKLKDNEQLFKLIVENANDMISIHNPDTSFKYISPSVKNVFGYEVDEMMKLLGTEIIHPEDISKIREQYSNLLDNNFEESIITYRSKHKDGNYYWYESNNKGIYEPSKTEPEKMELKTIVTVSRNVTIKKEKEDLEKQKELLKKANKTKSEFLANMSHEIRNPMNSLVGIINSLSKTDLDDKQKQFVNILKISSNNLINILNDILDYTKIEENKLEVNKSIFDFHELVEDVLELFKNTCNEKGIRIELDIKDNVDQYINNDSILLRQLMYNLISNAVKFTDEGGVVIKVEQNNYELNNKCLKFTVTDTGIGIKDENIPELFESFTQLDITSQKKYQGTGLGLYIVKKIIQLLNGKTSVKSIYGLGSEFSFEIPLDILRNTTNKTTKYSKGENLLKEKILVLLVEDDKLNRLYLTDFLSEKGFEVEIAVNGQEVIDKYKTKRYDIILMDIQMPIIDGFEATKEIREIEKNKNIFTPIIAVTGYASVGDRERFISAGMNDYVTKPIDENVLIETINRFCLK